MVNKGIVLAGGSGTRLHPLTLTMCKQLLPVYDKPMIYYPLSALMLAGIKEILIITTPKDQSKFQDLLGNGKQFGISLSYAVQKEPKGIPQAFEIAADFIGGESVCLVLGDNVFFGPTFSMTLKRVAHENEGATIFAYHVPDPERYGIVDFDGDRVQSIDEKPVRPRSNFAITGIYFFDGTVTERAQQLSPSERGETEIVDLLQTYLDEDRLAAEKLRRGFAWLDTGTHDSLLQASNFVQTVVQLQDLQVACLEEIAWRNGWISRAELICTAERFGNVAYGRYLKRLTKDSI